ARLLAAAEDRSAGRHSAPEDDRYCGWSAADAPPPRVAPRGSALGAPCQWAESKALPTRYAFLHTAGCATGCEGYRDAVALRNKRPGPAPRLQGARESAAPSGVTAIARSDVSDNAPTGCRTAPANPAAMDQSSRPSLHASARRVSADSRIHRSSQRRPHTPCNHLSAGSCDDHGAGCETSDAATAGCTNAALRPRQPNARGLPGPSSGNQTRRTDSVPAHHAAQRPPVTGSFDPSNDRPLPDRARDRHAAPPLRWQRAWPRRTRDHRSADENRCRYAREIRLRSASKEATCSVKRARSFG